VVPLFDPRQIVWTDHFTMAGAEILGLSAIGRATARLLQMNDHRRLALRSLLIGEGEF